MTTETLSSSAASRDTDTFVTFTVAGQLFGVPVMRVQDILTPDDIAAVPGGPAQVRGLINLRGRIVTVIDMRTHLALPPADSAISGMCVTVEDKGEAYTLYVDSVGDVVVLNQDAREANPATLDPVWRQIADAVYRTDQGLLVALQVDRLLSIGTEA